MHEDALIKIEGVSKKFCRNLKRSLIYGIQDILNEFKLAKSDVEHLRPDEFWALENISFDLHRGECLGLIGKNGAGKSTILKLLNGLIKPDTGKITVCGRMGALTELGAGFNPILTGRENIYINGSLLGISKKEIDTKMDEIIDFAEIKDFIDMPVQNYSSGMRVRLGFAIAVQMNPDILLIDEVLAVGDMGFRMKCYSQITKILKNTAVIFVSHSMGQVNRICNKVILLEGGHKSFLGSPEEGIDKYYDIFRKEQGTITAQGNNSVTHFKISSVDGSDGSYIEYGQSARIDLKCNISKEVVDPYIKMYFHDKGDQIIAHCLSLNTKFVNRDGVLQTSVILGPLYFAPGHYKISLIVQDKPSRRNLLWYNNYWDLEISGGYQEHGASSILIPGKWQT